MKTRRHFLHGLSIITGMFFGGGALYAITKSKAKRSVMFTIRRSEERGLADHGWLKSRHTFSFASYYDPRQMGFKNLRVINEDRIDGGTGFGSHPHNDMEIISYVVKGALEHKDSMGTKAVIKPGEVQIMSAGSGIVHSEQNANPSDETHFFQIWIQPKLRGITPRYGQKSFEKELNSKKLVLVVSQDGREGSIAINQDADMSISRLKAKDSLEYNIRPGRGLWLQVVKGNLVIDDATLKTGDALSSENSGTLSIKATEDSEIILFDLV